MAAAYMDGEQPRVNFMELLMGGDQVRTTVWGLTEVGLTTALRQWNPKRPGLHCRPVLGPAG